MYPLFCCHFVPPGRHFTVYQIKIMHFNVLRLVVFIMRYSRSALTNASPVFCLKLGHVVLTSTQILLLF